MVKCEECGKKLGILQGYRHPALGRRFLVCGFCFDKVDESMEKWSAFCHSNLFNTESSKTDIQVAWNKSIAHNLELQKWFNNLWIKKGISDACRIRYKTP
jgi:hypothetical protein